MYIEFDVLTIVGSLATLNPSLWILSDQQLTNN